MFKSSFFWFIKRIINTPAAALIYSFALISTLTASNIAPNFIITLLSISLSIILFAIITAFDSASIFERAYIVYISSCPAKLWKLLLVIFTSYLLAYCPLAFVVMVFFWDASIVAYFFVMLAYLFFYLMLSFSIGILIKKALTCMLILTMLSFAPLLLSFIPRVAPLSYLEIFFGTLSPITGLFLSVGLYSDSFYSILIGDLSVAFIFLIFSFYVCSKRDLC